MENKQRCDLNEVFSKGKCITDFFVKNTVDSIILPLVLMMPGCSCTRRAGAATSIVGGAGFANEQTEVGVLPDCIQQEKTPILYSKKNTAAEAGDVVENDISRRRISMLPGCGCSATAVVVVSAEDIVSPEAEMERLESAVKWL